MSGRLKSFSIHLYLVQSVFENCSRGQIGICIGLNDIVATIGMWSDGVIGPGLRWVFRYGLLLFSAMPFFRRVLAVALVSKKGPLCLHSSVSIKSLMHSVQYIRRLTKILLLEGIL